MINQIVRVATTNNFNCTAKEWKQLKSFQKENTDKYFFMPGLRLMQQTQPRENLPLTSLNLSSSGICKFNCPDCYAKRMQLFSRAIGNTPIKFDDIKANNKQAGKTKHIKEALNV